MIKLRSKRFCRGSFKLGGNGGGGGNTAVKGNERGSCGGTNNGEIKWELRPGGMLVQKMDVGDGSSGPMIKIKVSHGSCHYDTDVPAQSTFGKHLSLKLIVRVICFILV